MAKIKQAVKTALSIRTRGYGRWWYLYSQV